MRGRGKRRAGEDNVRLRQENKLLEARLAWYRSRLRAVGGQSRTLRSRAEIAEGRLAAAELLIQRQVEQLMERDSRVARLTRQLQATGDDTVETPIPTAAQLAAA